MGYCKDCTYVYSEENAFGMKRYYCYIVETNEKTIVKPTSSCKKFYPKDTKKSSGFKL